MAAASAPPTEKKPRKPDRAKCGAKTRAGGKCQRRAGAGTDHIGKGRCTNHGGGNAISQIARKARHRADLLGLELDLEPHDALLTVVRRRAAWAAYCANEVAHLEAEELVVTFRRERDTTFGVGDSYIETSNAAVLHIWAQESLKADEALTRASKTAIDAGVQERQVRLEEQLAAGIADAFDALLSGHGITGEKRKPEVVRAALRVLEGGKAA